MDPLYFIENIFEYTEGFQTFLTVFLYISAIAAAVMLPLFLHRKHDNKFKGFLGWLRNYLNFDELLLDILIRWLYLTLALTLTLTSFVFLFGNYVAQFFGVLIVGNLSLRLLFELTMMVVSLVKNVSEINQKLRPPDAPLPAGAETPEEEAKPEETLFCRQCGVRLEPGSSFCHNCGHKVNNYKPEG